MSMLPRFALALLAMTALAAPSAAQTVYVHVGLEGPEGRTSPDGGDLGDEGGGRGGFSACSVLQIEPDGTLFELVSNAEILAATGETEAACEDTALTVAPDGTIYFAESRSGHILRVSADGVVSVFVEEADIDTLLGVSHSPEGGMDVGPDGTLFVADSNCDCIYSVSPDGQTLDLIVTETAIALETGNRDFVEVGRGQDFECTGDPVAALEGGLAVGPDGTVYFTDDGRGCSPGRMDPGSIRGEPTGLDSLAAVLRAVPDGLGGYTVSIVADEDDMFADAPSAFPGGFGDCEVNYVELEFDIDLGSDGFLYVLEGGLAHPAPESCQGGRGAGEDPIVADDKLFRIDPDSGSVSLVVDAAAFGALSGAPDPDNQAELAGGIATGGSDLFVGDRVRNSQVGNRGLTDRIHTIFRVSASGGVSVLLSDEDLQAFYGPRYGGAVAMLEGGLDAGGTPSVLEVPVGGTPWWVLFGALLGVLGLWAVRRNL